MAIIQKVYVIKKFDKIAGLHNNSFDRRADNTTQREREGDNICYKNKCEGLCYIYLYRLN